MAPLTGQEAECPRSWREVGGGNAEAAWLNSKFPVLKYMCVCVCVAKINVLFSEYQMKKQKSQQWHL